MPEPTRMTPRRIALAVDALQEVFALLATMQVGPRVRALRAKAESYRQVIDRWISLPPTSPQHAALLELVVELLEQARETLANEERPPSSQTVARLAQITVKPGATK